MVPDSFKRTECIGRAKEIEALSRIVSAAKSGEANGVFIAGKGSIGKSSLLKCLYIDLFKSQSDVLPFLYAMNRALLSAKEFSRDYIRQFILRGLAFQTGDDSMISGDHLSLEELEGYAANSEALWAVDIINDYHKARSGDPSTLISLAVSLPSRYYSTTGRPVLVMVDDFQLADELYIVSPGDSPELWTCFEPHLKNGYTPHVIAGQYAGLYRMFYEKTAIGDNLEILNLSGLKKEESSRLFKSLGESSDLKVGSGLLGFINLFKGNPFYLRSYYQAVRQSGGSPSDEECLEIYLNEVTRGKIYTYWAARLKKHIRSFSMRRPSLNVLNYLRTDGIDSDYSEILRKLSMSSEELEHLIDLLDISGTIDAGFSLIEISDDPVLIDVIKGLYLREVLRSSAEEIRDTIIGDKRTGDKYLDETLFKVTVPYESQSELVVVKALQQIAKQFRIADETTGRMQIAIIELFTSISAKGQPYASGYDVCFYLNNNIFSVEVLSRTEDLGLTDEDSNYIRAYLDDMKIEKLTGGTKITLIRNISEDLVASS